MVSLLPFAILMMLANDNEYAAWRAGRLRYWLMS
jgi:hypothetical protein